MKVCKKFVKDVNSLYLTKHVEAMVEFAGDGRFDAPRLQINMLVHFHLLKKVLPTPPKNTLYV